MAINKNHEFDDLDGIKCSVVEKNINRPRAEFLKNLLQKNGFTVVIIPSPPAKVAVAKPAAEGEGGVQSTEQVPTSIPTFTLGVTDLTFNPTNAIFGRLLKTNTGHIVTQAFWNQQETVSHDEEPYYVHTKLKKDNEN